MRARSSRRRGAAPPGDGLDALIETEARLDGELAAARAEAAAVLAEAGRRVAEQRAAGDDPLLAAEAEAIDEEMARELAAVEFDLARRLAAHAAATAAVDELASAAIDRLLAALTREEAA